MFSTKLNSAAISAVTYAFLTAVTLAQPAAPPAGIPQGGRPDQGGGRGRPQNTAQAIVQVKPGLYMVTGAGANSMVRITNEGVLLVDAKNLGEANYTALLAQIKAVSDKPVKFVVIGDVHQDKSGNTGPFVAAGAQVIAHENEKKGLDTYTNPAGTPAAPNVTYKTDYSVRMDNKEVAHVYHFGGASTGGDSITYFPDLKVVVMGDVFQQGMNCDYAQGGSMIEWPKTLEAVLKLDFDTVIPNRGDPAKRGDLEAALKRVATIVSTATDLVKKGTPKEQLIAQINATDASLNAGAFLLNNATRLDAFYAEISKAAK